MPRPGQSRDKYIISTLNNHAEPIKQNLSLEYRVSSFPNLPWFQNRVFRASKVGKCHHPSWKEQRKRLLLLQHWLQQMFFGAGTACADSDTVFLGPFDPLDLKLSIMEKKATPNALSNRGFSVSVWIFSQRTLQIEILILTPFYYVFRSAVVYKIGLQHMHVLVLSFYRQLFASLVLIAIAAIFESALDSTVFWCVDVQ